MKTLNHYSYNKTLYITEDPPAGGTDVDLQLLEASKAGDMEVVKVTTANS